MLAKIQHIRDRLKRELGEQPLLILGGTFFFFFLVTSFSSTKFFFVFSILYLFFLLLVTKDILQAFLYAYFPFRLFPMGQVSIYTAVPREVLNLPFYPDGRQLYFMFSPFFVLGITAIVVCCFSLFRYRKFQTPLYLFLFLLGGAGALVSGAATYYSPTFSFLYALIQVSQVSFFFIAFFLIKTLSPSKQRGVWITLLLLAGSCLVFETGVAFLQFIVRGPLGIGIEGVDIAPYFGEGADESSLIPRSLGLRAHFNLLAYEWLPFPFIILGMLRSSWIQRQSKEWSQLFQVLFLLSCFLLLLTVSRAAWMALAAGLICAFLWDTEFLSKQVLLFLEKILTKRLVFYFLILCFAFIVPLRVIKSLESFSSVGGASVRTALRGVALSTFRTRPTWGVGPGMFIPAGFDTIINDSVLLYFPESVHNGFWLLMSEQGLVGLLLFCSALFFFWRSIIQSLQRKKNFPLGYSALSMVVVMVMVLFHPFHPFLHWSTMLTVLILHTEGDI